MGREMARLLLHGMRNAEGPPRRVILDTSLTIRQSSAPM
jgi:DNA-binding LacI/PurR family transcriptional regulator